MSQSADLVVGAAVFLAVSYTTLSPLPGSEALSHHMHCFGAGILDPLRIEINRAGTTKTDAPRKGHTPKANGCGSLRSKGWGWGLWALGAGAQVTFPGLELGVPRIRLSPLFGLIWATLDLLWCQWM